MKRTTFSTKARAKKFRGAGRRVYKVKHGWKVSPSCPRKDAKRRALMKGRTKTLERGRRHPEYSRALYAAVKWAQVPF